MGNAGADSKLTLYTNIEITDLTLFFWVISKKSLEITDFSGFEETFRNECRERNEWRGAESKAEAGVPFGVAVAKDVATRSEWSERNEWRKRLEKP